MKLLELFSGTHSIGKVAKHYNFEVTSLDRDLESSCPFDTGYISNKHFKEDILTWDYKQYPVGYFDLITASPVCLWWSQLRYSHIGRGTTKEQIEKDLIDNGKPMVDKVIEIIEYFKPKYWWIENPQTGRMKDYIASKYPEYNSYYDVDYCQYSDWGYKKRTRFWSNILGFEPKLCKAKNHKKQIGRTSDFRNKKEFNYRIPFSLIRELLNCCV